MAYGLESTAAHDSENHDRASRDYAPHAGTVCGGLPATVRTTCRARKIAYRPRLPLTRRAAALVRTRGFFPLGSLAFASIPRQPRHRESVRKRIGLGPATREATRHPLRCLCNLVRIQPRLCGTATAPAGTKPAPPVEESDEQSDKYGDQDDGADDAGNRDEGFHKS